MYAAPGLEAAVEAWWQGLARAFRAEGLAEVPDALAAGSPEDHWADPELMFGQTCGYPLTHRFAGKLTVVATPAYTAAGCAGARYRSAFVVRADEPAAELAALAGRRAAVNGRESQSGYSALRHAVAPLARDGRFFAEVIVSGSHRDSLRAVAEGRADLAAIDCVTLALNARLDPALVGASRVLGYSAEAPGLPYVTAAHHGPETLARLRAGLRRACADPALAPAREALLIAGVEQLPGTAYQRILEMEAEAAALGYPELL